MPTFLEPGDQDRLELLVLSTGSSSIRLRARLLLKFEEGLGARDIAKQFDAPVNRVLHWRRTYLKLGLAMFDGTEEG